MRIEHHATINGSETVTEDVTELGWHYIASSRINNDLIKHKSTYKKLHLICRL